MYSPSISVDSFLFLFSSLFWFSFTNIPSQLFAQKWIIYGHMFLPLDLMYFGVFTPCVRVWDYTAPSCNEPCICCQCTSSLIILKIHFRVRNYISVSIGIHQNKGDNWELLDSFFFIL